MIEKKFNLLKNGKEMTKFFWIEKIRSFPNFSLLSTSSKISIKNLSENRISVKKNKWKLPMDDFEFEPNFKTLIYVFFQTRKLIKESLSISLFLSLSSFPKKYSPKAWQSFRTLFQTSFLGHPNPLKENLLHIYFDFIDDTTN